MSVILLGGDFILTGLSMLDGKLVVPASVGYREFASIVNSVEFKRYKNLPTRHGNLLERLLPNTPNIIRNTSVSPGMSDHYFVYAELFLTNKIRRRYNHKGV